MHDPDRAVRANLAHHDVADETHVHAHDVAPAQLLEISVYAQVELSLRQGGVLVQRGQPKPEVDEVDVPLVLGRRLDQVSWSDDVRGIEGRHLNTRGHKVVAGVLGDPLPMLQL